MTKRVDNNYRLIHRRLFVICILFMLIIKGISPASLTATDVEDKWQSRPNMLTKRFGLAAAVVNGRIYVIGGSNDEDGLLATVEEYDPATGIWRTRADMLTPRNRLAVAVVNEKIYAIGGWDGSNVSATAIVEEYDPMTNQWTTKSSMLTPRRSLTAAVVGGRFYAIGGWNETDVFATVEEYDSTTDTWRIRADMPTPRVGLAAAVVNDRIFAIGGSDEPDPYATVELSTVEEYDPVTDSWRGHTPMPTYRDLLAAVAMGGRLYAIGGHRQYYNRENQTFWWSDESFQTVEEYDPTTYTWQIRANMTTGRWGLATVAVGDKIYAIGGINENDWLSTVEEYNPPIFDTDGDGLADKDELGSYNTDPFSLDTDNDGLTDGGEVNTYGTNPVLADAAVDTDGDGLVNVAEVDTYKTNPVLADAAADTDGDGLVNVAEVDTYGTDPQNDDTDVDRLSDGDEVELETDPLVEDTDSDGLSDGDEVIELKTDPLDPDTDKDDILDGMDPDPLNPPEVRILGFTLRDWSYIITIFGGVIGVLFGIFYRYKYLSRK